MRPSAFSDCIALCAFVKPVPGEFLSALKAHALHLSPRSENTSAASKRSSDLPSEFAAMFSEQD